MVKLLRANGRKLVSELLNREEFFCYDHWQWNFRAGARSSRPPPFPISAAQSIRSIVRTISYYSIHFRAFILKLVLMLLTRCKPPTRCKLSLTRCILEARTYKVHLVSDSLQFNAYCLQVRIQIVNCWEIPHFQGASADNVHFFVTRMGASWTLSVPRYILLMTICIL